MNTRTIIDLTHELHSSIPSWNEGCGFKSAQVLDYAQGCRTHQFEMRAGCGTHIDAPIHFIPNAADVAAIPLEKLVVSAFVINIAEKAHADYFVTPDDIINFENKHGNITEDSLVIFHTGWSTHWNNPEQYRNVDKNNMMHFPGISELAAKLLLERNIAGIAIDTLSPDGSNLQFPVHHVLLGAEKYIIENITNAHLLPPVGATVIALPPKIQSATEAPLRVIGILS